MVVTHGCEQTLQAHTDSDNGHFTDVAGFNRTRHLAAESIQ